MVVNANAIRIIVRVIYRIRPAVCGIRRNRFAYCRRTCNKSMVVNANANRIIVRVSHRIRPADCGTRRNRCAHCRRTCNKSICVIKTFAFILSICRSRRSRAAIRHRFASVIFVRRQTPAANFRAKFCSRYYSSAGCKIRRDHHCRPPNRYQKFEESALHCKLPPLPRGIPYCPKLVHPGNRLGGQCCQN